MRSSNANSNVHHFVFFFLNKEGSMPDIGLYLASTLLNFCPEYILLISFLGNYNVDGTEFSDVDDEDYYAEPEDFESSGSSAGSDDESGE